MRAQNSWATPRRVLSLVHTPWVNKMKWDVRVTRSVAACEKAGMHGRGGGIVTISPRGHPMRSTGRGLLDFVIVGTTLSSRLLPRGLETCHFAAEAFEPPNKIRPQLVHPGLPVTSWPLALRTFEPCGWFTQVSGAR